MIYILKYHIILYNLYHLIIYLKIKIPPMSKYTWPIICIFDIKTDI